MRLRRLSAWLELDELYKLLEVFLRLKASRRLWVVFLKWFSLLVSEWLVFGGGGGGGGGWLGGGSVCGVDSSA